MSVAALPASMSDYAYYALLALALAWILISWFPTYPSHPVLQKVYAREHIGERESYGWKIGREAGEVSEREAR